MRPPLSLHHKKRRLHSLKAQYTSEATSANDGLKWHFDDNRNREKGRRQRRYFKIKSNDRWGTILICVDLTALSHCSNSWSVMVCWIFQSCRTTKNGKVKPMMLICAGDVMWFCLKGFEVGLSLFTLEQGFVQLIWICLLGVWEFRWICVANILESGLCLGLLYLIIG